MIGAVVGALVFAIIGLAELALVKDRKSVV